MADYAFQGCRTLLSMRTTVGSIEPCASRGCNDCELILKALQIYGYTARDLTLMVCNAGIKCYNQNTPEITLNFFSTDPVPDTDKHIVRRGMHISGDTSSAASLRWAVNRILRCTKNHPTCHSKLSTHPLPNRVLDLDLGDGSSDIKLYETMNEEARYMCLSHCWGGYQPLCTNKATLHDRKKRIPWDSLPKTFQDAIAFTRKLRIRYLWIDSLCIIQDDDDDWKREAAQMAAVYSHSFLTLAATRAGSCVEGCFSVANPKFRAHRLTYTTRNGEKLVVFVRLQLPHLSTLDHFGVKPSKDTPLLHRAWVYQERLLSPRVLHFLSNELMWECMEATTCECYLGENPMIDDCYASHPKTTHTQLLLHAGRVKSVYKKKKALNSRWHSLVCEYCQLKLTFEKDIFPALSGIVKEMRTAREPVNGKERYLAGLWEGNFIQDLLWEANGIRTRPQSWRAPTWSWASVIASSISYNEHCLENISRIVDVDYNPTGSDETGEISRASLTITGPITTATILYIEKSWGKMFELLLENGENVTLWEDYPLLDPGKYHVEPGSSVYCLGIAGDFNSKHRCLTLRCLDGVGRVFERIGYCDLQFRKEWAERMPDAEILYGRGLKRLHGEGFERKPVEDWPTITIL